RHKAGELFVTRLNEAHAIAGAIECADHAIDAVGRISIDPINAPRRQAFEDDIRNRLRHGVSPSFACRVRDRNELTLHTPIQWKPTLEGTSHAPHRGK